MPDDKDKQKSDDKDAKQTDKDGRPERIESNASATKSTGDKTSEEED